MLTPICAGALWAVAMKRPAKMVKTLNCLVVVIDLPFDIRTHELSTAHTPLRLALEFPQP